MPEPERCPPTFLVGVRTMQLLERVDALVQDIPMFLQYQGTRYTHDGDPDAHLAHDDLRAVAAAARRLRDALTEALDG